MQSHVRFKRVPEKVPEKVPDKVWEALVQNQVRFNKVPEKVLEKVWGASGQSQVKFKRVPEKVPEKVWEPLVQSQVRFNRVCGHLTHGNPAEVFPALVFAARFRKICKNKMLRLLGIPPKLIFHFPKPKKRHADAPKQAEPAPFAFPGEAVAPVSGLQSAQNNDTGMQHPNISPDYECNNMLSPGREICQS